MISVYVKITPHHVRITPHVVCVRQEYVTLQDSAFSVIVLMASLESCATKVCKQTTVVTSFTLDLACGCHANFVLKFP